MELIPRMVSSLIAAKKLDTHTLGLLFAGKTITELSLDYSDINNAQLSELCAAQPHIQELSLVGCLKLANLSFLARLKELRMVNIVGSSATIPEGMCAWRLRDTLDHSLCYDGLVMVIVMELVLNYHRHHHDCQHSHGFGNGGGGDGHDHWFGSHEHHLVLCVDWCICVGCLPQAVIHRTPANTVD